MCRYANFCKIVHVDPKGVLITLYKLQGRVRLDYILAKLVSGYSPPLLYLSPSHDPATCFT